MGREDMRAGDADRQRVADQLTSALQEGRLDLGEYDERVQGAYAAKTYGDLDRLLTDLPDAAPVVPAQPVPVPVSRPEGSRSAWLTHVWAAWVKTGLILTVIYALSAVDDGDWTDVWPLWVLGPWGALLLVRSVRGLSDGEPGRWAAEQVHREQLREHKRERKALEAEAVARGELPENPSKEERKSFIAGAVERGDLAPKPRKPGV